MNIFSKYLKKIVNKTSKIAILFLIMLMIINIYLSLFITAWVVKVADKYLFFLSGEYSWIIILAIKSMVVYTFWIVTLVCLAGVRNIFVSKPDNYYSFLDLKVFLLIITLPFVYMFFCPYEKLPILFSAFLYYVFLRTLI